MINVGIDVSKDFHEIHILEIRKIREISGLIITNSDLIFWK